MVHIDTQEDLGLIQGHHDGTNNLLEVLVTMLVKCYAYMISNQHGKVGFKESTRLGPCTSTHRRSGIDTGS